MKKNQIVLFLLFLLFCPMFVAPGNGGSGNPDYTIDLYSGEFNEFCTTILDFGYQKAKCFNSLNQKCRDAAYELCGQADMDDFSNEDHRWFFSPDPIPDTGCIECSSTCKVWCDLGFDWGDCWAVGTREDCELTCRPMYGFNGYCVPLGNPDVEGKGCWGCSDRSTLIGGGGSKPRAPFIRMESPNGGSGGGGRIDCWSVCVEYQSGRIDCDFGCGP